MMCRREFSRRRVNEMKLAIEEMKHLYKEAFQPRTQELLANEICRLEKEVSRLWLADKGQIYPAPNESPIRKCYDVVVKNYGWDQTNTKIKLYITLEKVHKLSKEKIICKYTKNSLYLHVKELNYRNYILDINNLCEEINDHQSTVKIKTDMIVLLLMKKVPKEWSYVTQTEKYINEAKAVIMSKTGLGSNNMIDIMKNIYVQGNDEVKRTIAKAWTESQEKSSNLRES